MPGFDGTGPRGLGTGTGGGRGPCRRYTVPWTANYEAVSPLATGTAHEQGLDFLRRQAQALKDNLESIEARLWELENEEK